MEDTNDAAAEREFRQAVVDELHKLVARGVEHGEAVDILLRRLCGGDLRPNDAEVAALTGSLDYTRQDAVRALVVRGELRALKAQGLDNAAATRQLTHRVRREATAARAASSQTLPDQQAPPVERQPLAERPPVTHAYDSNGAIYPDAARTLAAPAPLHQPGESWGYCNGPIAVASQQPQPATVAGSRGAAPAWAPSGGVGGMAELKSSRTIPPRKRSAPMAAGGNDSGSDPMDADGEPETKRRRATRPPSPHHLQCYHAAHHGIGGGGLGTGHSGAGGGGGGGGGSCGCVHGCSSCKRARSPGREDGSGGGGGGGGGGHHKRHRTS